MTYLILLETGHSNYLPYSEISVPPKFYGRGATTPEAARDLLVEIYFSMDERDRWQLEEMERIMEIMISNGKFKCLMVVE